MKQVLVLCLSVLLLVSCGKTGKQLTLIFENAPENSRAMYHSDSVPFVQKENTVKRLYYFTPTPDKWLEEYIPQGANDTLRIACSNGSHIEFYHRYRLYTYHYALLQAGDTVYIHYEADGTPVYRSSISSTLTTLYNADALVFGRPPQDFKDELYYNLYRSIYLEKSEKRSGKKRKNSYPSVSGLMALHNENILKAEAKIDSLINANTMLAEYRQYYSYRIKKLAIEPEVMRFSTPILIDSLQLDQKIYNFFNDDYCGNISYWHTVGELSLPMVREGGAWKPPLIRNASGRNVFDETAVFDRLDLFASKVPPSTLNMMRYTSLVRIAMPEYGYPQEVYQQYFDKYRRHTTDFLLPEYIPARDTVGFPFRFFVFLLEFIACTGAFFYIYQLLLKDKVGYLTSRLYLLAALVLSAAIPLFALPVHIAMLPDSALFWSGSMLSSVLQILLYIYPFGCLYLLTSFAWQLYSIHKMKKESWSVPTDHYNLHILTNIEIRPFAFFRNIFFSWDDWWNTENKEARNQLLAHEEAHVRLWHSLDNMLVMLGRILYWVNPLLLTYGKEIRRINEFAADCAVTRTYSPESYMNALKATNTGYAKMENSLVSNSEDDFAERFSKIRAKAIPWYKNFRFLVIVPLIIILMLLFSSEIVINLGKLSSDSSLPPPSW